jgi:hypothetical protein
MRGKHSDDQTDPIRRRVLRTGAGALIAASGAAGAGCLGISGLGGPSPETQVENAQGAWEKYADLRTALQDGYRTTGIYRTREGGVVGEVLVNYEVKKPKSEQPQVLLYNLSDDGQYELVGGEWYKPTEDADSPPSLFGTEFAGPVPAVPGLPKRYALRVWFASENSEGLFALANPSLSPPAYAEDLGTAREALRPLRNGAKAQQGGYRNTEKCVTISPDAGYGVPFVRKGEGPTAELANPPILPYRLTSNWSYALMGAEWWVPADQSPPDLFGVSWHDPMPAHSPRVDRPEHRGLHAWLFRANPAGMFAPGNPLVNC